jgi:CheY-like chemotaxis protein
VAAEIIPFHIVLAEDNPGDVFLIREALREHEVDANITHFEDGEAAIAGFSAQLWDNTAFPDLIVLDLNLPKANGFQVLTAIKSTPALSGIPVAILTSSRSPEDRRLTASLGATDYIQKPVGLDEFLGDVGRALRDLLTNSRLRRGRPA